MRRRFLDVARRHVGTAGEIRAVPAPRMTGISCRPS